MRWMLLSIFVLQGMGATVTFIDARVAAACSSIAGAMLILYLFASRRAREQAFEKLVTARTADLVDLVHQHQRASITDPLTGLLNRRGGIQEIHRHLARCRRIGSPISFLMVDIDYFKKVNDTYGHCFGDEVLMEVGRTVATTLRASDFAVRWGGEEMLVVLPDTDLDGSILVGEKLRKTVGEIRFDQDVTITISLGASEVAETEEFTTTLARADMNLYVAKASGRNCTRPVHHEKRT